MSPRYGRRISAGHVIWAYDRTIAGKRDEGLTPPQIRAWLRDECSLNVSVEAVRDVLRSLEAAS